MNPRTIVQNKIGAVSSKHRNEVVRMALKCSTEPIVLVSNNNGDRDWAGLLPELLAEIAIRLPYMEDFAAFREVCKPWRAAATKDRCKNKFKSASKIPFLMLAEKEGGSDGRQLFSLYKNTVWATMSFPWFKSKRCMDVGFGWVIAVAFEGWEVSLVKPTTGATIELPNLTTCPYHARIRPQSMFILRGNLSADPSRTSDFVLMVLSPAAGLGYWRLGWTDWRVVDNPLPRCLFHEIGYYKGKMIDLDYRGNVRMRDPSAAADFTKSEFIVQVVLTREYMGMRPYLVESSSGELLLLYRDNVGYSDLVYGADGFQTQFKVARIDVEKGTYERVEGGIGKDAIFVGGNATVAVDASDFPGVIKPNCIYYTDDCLDIFSYPNDPHSIDNKGGGRDMGVYNFEDGSIQRFPLESLSTLCPPLWIFPSF